MTDRTKSARLAAARGACAITTAALALLGSAAAQTMPKEGTYDVTNCWSGTSREVAFSKTHNANGSELVGSTRSNPPGGPFDKVSFHCVSIGATIDGKTTGSYYCEAADKDGDKFMVRGATEGPKGKAETIAGTGKYEGMVRVGTSESAGPFPAVQPGAFTGCHRQTGTYKMK